MQVVQEKIKVKNGKFDYIPMFDYRNISTVEKPGYVHKVYKGNLSRRKYNVYVPKEVKGTIHGRCTLCGHKHRLSQVVVTPIGYVSGYKDGQYMVDTRKLHKGKPVAMWICSGCSEKLDNGDWLVLEKTNQIFVK